MNPSFGKTILLIGLAIALFGAVIYLFGDKLNWIGRLPGDIRIEKENFKFYFPITTMILISLLLTIGVRVFRKFF